MNNTEISTTIVETEIQKIEQQKKKTKALNKLKNQFQDLLNQENIIISNYNENPQSLLDITDIENIIKSNLTIDDFKSLVAVYAIKKSNKETFNDIVNNYYNINTYNLHIFSLLLIYSLQLNNLDINQMNTFNCLNLLLLNQTKYLDELKQMQQNYKNVCDVKKKINFKKCIKIQNCLINNIKKQIEKYNLMNTIYLQYLTYLQNLVNSGVQNIDYFIAIKNNKINTEKSNLIAIIEEFYKLQEEYNKYVFFML
jgi:hypothetical protein